jgi:hypothetical protein
VDIARKVLLTLYLALKDTIASLAYQVLRHVHLERMEKLEILVEVICARIAMVGNTVMAMV